MIGGALLQTIVNGVTSNRYLFHDQLGSVVKATDALGSVLHGLDYIPNGARRSVSDPTQVTDTSPALTERGFTGHEHVDGFDLIHMNGRIYDPSLGRFLQADPLIQAPENAQSWNAYTYVFNNPLRYTDPTGMLGQEERQWLGAIIMIAAIATQQYWAANFTGPYAAAMTAGVYAGVGFVSGVIATQSWRGGLMGAMTAMIGAGIAGAGAGAGGFEAWGLQTFTGGVMGSLQGGDFGHAFLSAGLSAAFMPHVGEIGNPVGRTVTGAIVGGTISRMTGGKFANGAVSGAIQAAMAGGRDRKGLARGKSKKAFTPREDDTTTGRFGLFAEYSDDPVAQIVYARATRGQRLSYRTKGEVGLFGGTDASGNVVAPDDFQRGTGGRLWASDLTAMEVTFNAAYPGGSIKWYYHSHGVDAGDGRWENFSDDDLNIARRRFDKPIMGHASTPRGLLLRFDPSAGDPVQIGRVPPVPVR